VDVEVLVDEVQALDVEAPVEALDLLQEVEEEVLQAEGLLLAAEAVEEDRQEAEVVEMAEEVGVDAVDVMAAEEAVAVEVV
jgi:hypothetical protein